MGTKPSPDVWWNSPRKPAGPGLGLLDHRFGTGDGSVPILRPFVVRPGKSCTSSPLSTASRLLNLLGTVVPTMLVRSFVFLSCPP